MHVMKNIKFSWFILSTSTLSLATGLLNERKNDKEIK